MEQSHWQWLIRSIDYRNLIELSRRRYLSLPFVPRCLFACEPPKQETIRLEHAVEHVGREQILNCIPIQHQGAIPFVCLMVEPYLRGLGNGKDYFAQCGTPRRDPWCTGRRQDTCKDHRKHRPHWNAPPPAKLTQHPNPADKSMVEIVPEL